MDPSATGEILVATPCVRRARFLAAGCFVLPAAGYVVAQTPLLLARGLPRFLLYGLYGSLAVGCFSLLHLLYPQARVAAGSAPSAGYGVPAKAGAVLFFVAPVLALFALAPDERGADGPLAAVGIVGLLALAWLLPQRAAACWAPPRIAPAPSNVLGAVCSYAEWTRARGGSSGGDACAICLAELRPREEVRTLLACSHVFHRACIETWCGPGPGRACPVCRQPAPPAAFASVVPGPPEAALPAADLERPETPPACPDRSAAPALVGRIA